MKFATKLSILFTVFFLAAGCVSQRGVGTGGGTSSQDNDNSNATGISGNAEDREGQMMLESSETIRAPKQKVGLLIAAKDLTYKSSLSKCVSVVFLLSFVFFDNLALSK